MFSIGRSKKVDNLTPTHPLIQWSSSITKVGSGWITILMLELPPPPRIHTYWEVLVLVSSRWAGCVWGVRMTAALVHKLHLANHQWKRGGMGVRMTAIHKLPLANH